jgi:predicted kinase
MTKFDWMQNPDNNKVLILMRGLPSSGKSTRAKELSLGDSSIICSTDDYWGKTKEEYLANWSLEKLGVAHGWCRKNARMLMQRQSPLVIVDNTNTVFREMMPYFDMAVQYQYNVKIEEPTSPWWVEQIAPYLKSKEKNRKHLEKMCAFLVAKNVETHGVPLSSMVKMMFRYAPNVTFEDLAKAYDPNEFTLE